MILLCEHPLLDLGSSLCAWELHPLRSFQLGWRCESFSSSKGRRLWTSVNMATAGGLGKSNCLSPCSHGLSGVIPCAYYETVDTFSLGTCPSWHTDIPKPQLCLEELFCLLYSLDYGYVTEYRIYSAHIELKLILFLCSMPVLIL